MHQTLTMTDQRLCLRLFFLGIFWLLAVCINQLEIRGTLFSLLNGNHEEKIIDSPSSRLSTPPPAHFWEALNSLNIALREDPVLLGSRSWSWNKTNSSPQSTENHAQSNISWSFDGLSSSPIQEAFQNKRLLMVGDSTLFYLHRWLQTIAMGGMTKQDLDLLEGMPMHAANEIVRSNVAAQETTFPRPTIRDVSKNGTMKSTSSEETVIVWDGYRGLTGERACHWELDAFWDRTRQFHPDILVVNFGLHWLHLQGGGRDVPLCYVDWWLRYEEWLERAYQVAEASNAKLLLFKTTNFFCESKFNGPYSDTIAKFKVDRLQLQQLYPSSSGEEAMQKNNGPNNYRRDTPMFDFCATQLEHKVALNATDEMTQLLSPNNIYRYCSEGTFDEMGVRNLNTRLSEFVQQKQQAQENCTSIRTVLPDIGIFNDHDLESCRYTLDGRHYDSLILVRIRVLANLIQAIYRDH